jgi:hypothetical protein
MQDNWESAFGLVAKDNTLCVENYGFEIRMGVFMNNYEIWELDSHLSNQKMQDHLQAFKQFIRR